MKGGNIFDNSYEKKAIGLIEKSMNVNMPLNQKSQEWYGYERADYLKDAISEIKDKIKILNDYSKGWRLNMYGINNLMYGMNNNKNNNKSSNSSTKKNKSNKSNSSNYNANNENMSGGKRYKKRHIKRTRRYRK